MSSKIFQTKLMEVQRNLLSFAYTLTSNRDDAYDLLQDTTLKALDSEDKYVDNVNFKGWVFTIMRNLFINKYRRQVRSVVVIDQSDDLYQLNLSQDSGIETPEGAVNAKEIRHMLAQLPPELGEPFTMYVRGYHYAEIAKEMELPLGTVKSRIFQARKRLQSALSDLRYD
ncbi:MAG: RNA polymerase sigma factor [Muribaculaceae bacterium]|nr:RNA polymerase sigma factor [Muribaculaceae bacterium]